MRDYVVLAIILGSAPIALFSPYYGVLVWNWIAFFNPHRYTWSFAYTFPVAQVIAVPTLLGLFFFGGKTNRPFFVRETVILLLFWMWCGFTLLRCSQTYELTGHFSEGLISFVEVSKILLMTFITILLVTSKEKLRYLLLVVALSFGIRALIAAYWGVTTGGQSRVYGPPDSFIADNNDFALALNMALPMLFFLAWDTESRPLRWLLRTCFVATIISVVLTYSRGGMLGLAAVLLGVMIGSKHKFLGAVLLGGCVFLVFAFATPKWMERMGNLAEGKLDRSAEYRLSTWKFTTDFVQAYPVTGGGIGVFEDADVKRQYAPDSFSEELIYTGAHSIYFQVLGEQGLVGFALFISLIGSCMFTLWSLGRRARQNPVFRWMGPYSRMLQLGFVAYAVSGATLGRAYFDLFFTLVACTSIMRIVYQTELRHLPQQETVPAAELELVPS